MANNDLTPSWLKSLQNNSWEPEILLSGIVLYGMFQVPDALDRFQFFFTNRVFGLVNVLDSLIALLKVGVYWLILGLISHLICRGLWIGMVGLNYSFPKGIDTIKLSFREKYQQQLENISSFQVIILRLEHLCSIIYSISFLLFMSLVGVYLFIFILVFIPLIVFVHVTDLWILHQDKFAFYTSLYILLIYFIGGLGVIDFLTLGYFRKFKIYAAIYWPFYRIFSRLTLAKFYRPTYYALATNLNRWGLSLFFLLFTVLSLFGMRTVQSSNRGEFLSRIDIWSYEKTDLAFEGYYQDRDTKFPSTQIQIASDIISDDVLRVFIPAKISFQDSLKKFMNYDSISNLSSPDFEQGPYLLGKIGEFYRLSIADSTFQTKMYFQNNSATSQRGYVTYLNIGYLREGLYELELSGPSFMYPDPFAIVPFYKATSSLR